MEQNIVNRLDRIEETLKIIQENMINTDIVLTNDDILSLEQADENLKKGKTKRLV